MTYVTMVDNFMSGWGMADGKKNVLIFSCENEEEKIKVLKFGQRRKEMSDVLALDFKPQYREDLFYAQDKGKEDFPIAYR